jgi:glycosyltransferase involved in cell wall biosynthesis
MKDRSFMRIAYVINGLDWGGAQSRLVAVLDEICRSGAHVEVFALSRRDGRAEGVLQDAGYTVHCYAGARSDHVRAAFWLNREMRAYHPTHLWSSLTQATLIGTLLAKRYGIPAAHWQHNAFLKPINLFLLKRVRRFVDLWVADSEAVAGLTRARLANAADDVMLWPLFSAAASRPIVNAWQSGDVFQFGSLGRLHRHKGYCYLLEAIAIVERERSADMPSFSVSIGGEGEEREALNALSKTRGTTHLIMAGFQSDPAAFLNALHCYVQPSLVEGFCIAMHEAMEAGIPIIATPVGEMATSLTPGETGYHVDAKNPRQLADAMLKMLADPKKAAEMGRAGRTGVLSRYGADAFAENGAAVVARLLGLARAA